MRLVPIIRGTRVHLQRQRQQEDHGIELEVSDDGVGFDPGDARLRGRRLGLTSMEERAARIEADLEIESGPGRGTTVRLRVPDG